ncbi:TIGR02117 family protein [Stakelama tenebrarum]|uniref:TIGR02117 family protein n=1 Tax=Stakelama tenebrarum TaxID=2711215 RepID=UPI001D196CAB|nr:TIGR02117 family protein [Sphingosinithalassobacter tenebrarum]
MLGIAALFALWNAAALAGTLIPVNAARETPESGIRVFVEDNGVHTGIVIPAQAVGIGWRDLVRPGDLRDPRHAAHGWLAIGWGDRNFYMETPTWWDVRPGRTLAAMAGMGETVLHVEHVPEPSTGPNRRALILTPAEYARLTDFIRASFADLPESWPGYGQHDAFYAAQGSYNLLRTCNNWTGEALREAGVPIGAWTPLSASVMFWMPQPDASSP